MKNIQPAIHREWKRGFKLAVKESNENKFIGGRATTVGASDIGGCLRQAYLGKVDNKMDSLPLEHILKMERGSIAETIVSKGLDSAKIETFDQVRLAHPEHPEYVCHIDFLLKGEDSLHILEVKTTNLEVSEPYESWVLQVIFQMTLLKLNYPGMTITASILALDLNSGWSEEFPVEYSDILYQLVMKKSQTLSNAITNKVEPEPAIQNYCGSCSYKMDCPVIVSEDSIDAKDLPKDIVTLIEEVKLLKQQDKLKKAKEKELKQILLGLNATNVILDDIITTISTNKGRISFDSKKFESEHPSQYQQYIKQGQPTTVLKVA